VFLWDMYEYSYIQRYGASADNTCKNVAILTCVHMSLENGTLP